MKKILEEIIYIKGEDKTDKISSIKLIDNIYYVTYKGLSQKEYAYKKNNIEIKRVERLDCDIYNYLKELSNSMSFKDTNTPYGDKEIRILKKYYSEFVLKEDESILFEYLENHNITKRKIDKPILFPFGFNPHQKKACENALESNVSIIDGPPGTGKTQTILNIIANILVQDKTVAVISNNNSATNNVYEKLKKYGLDKLCATLGKSSNINNFSSNSKRDAFPYKWRMGNIEQLKINLLNNYNKLSKFLVMKNRIAELKSDLDKVTLEYKYYSDRSYKKIYVNNEFDSNKILRINSYVDILGSNKTYLSSFSKKVLTITGIDKALLNNTVNDISDNLNRVYYERKISELEKEIKKLKTRLDDVDFNILFDEYTKNSMLVLKDYISNNYFKTDLISPKEIKNMERFSSVYPIILSTTYSLINCVQDGYKFDYIIVDESSQVDLVTSFLALSCGKNIVVVGDLKQLPIIVSKDMSKENSRIIKKYDIPNEWNYGYMNLLSTTIEIFKKAPHTLLKEHYRCHPEIIQFCNERFYNGDLIILSNNSSEKPLNVIKTKPGNHARSIGKSLINERQISVIKDEVLSSKELSQLDKIGIISPYRKQCELISEKVGKEIESLTVHKFQGREKDIIIFSTTGNEINEFINDPCLINVAISRAKDKFILVTHDGCENEKSLITDLIQYMQYHNVEISYSDISSVFDLLYDAYEKQRNIFISTHKMIRKFLSENLIYYTLRKIIDEKYPTLDFRCGYKLNDLIKDKSYLNERELKFVNTNSHLDFCIYRKMDKKTILVIEVDGRFHFRKEQIKRDRIKNEILNKYDIPLLRLATHGDREEDKILKKLDKVLRN